MKDKQKLSAMPYIRNNRRRVSVLVISLSLFCMMLYLLSFLLSVTTLPMEIAAPIKAEKAIFYTINSERFLDAHTEIESIVDSADIVREIIKSDAPKCEALPYIDHAIAANMHVTSLQALMGMTGTYTPFFFTTEDVEYYLEAYNGKIVEGRLPTEPGEIIVDVKLRKNWDAHDREVFDSSTFTIVGYCESDTYLCTGIEPSTKLNTVILIGETRGHDVKADIHNLGITYADVTTQEEIRKDCDREIVEPMETVKTLVTSVATILLSICLVAVLSLHIHDRHNEWCLMNSIGFSIFEIYKMAMRELLFCFGMAIGIGSILTTGTVAILYNTLIAPRGLVAYIFTPSMIFTILAVLAAILGICQIPLFISMQKIQTVDDIE